MNYTKENLVYYREDYRSMYQRIQKSCIPEEIKIENYKDLIQRIEKSYLENVEYFTLWKELKYEIKKIERRNILKKNSIEKITNGYKKEFL
jgi:deoxyadenosine/deoxycytidine kinase